MLIRKISDTSNLAKKAGLNAETTEIVNKIPSITGLVTNSALAAVENKISDISSLVKKTMINIYHDHDKYIITSELNKLTTENFNARLAQANLITKTDFDTRLQSLKRITSNKTKHLLVENQLKKTRNI